MKTLFTIFALSGLGFSAFAQESMEKIMEKRAKEMHRVIGLSDADQWKKFVKENYTQALIDKPMRSEAKTNTGKSTNSSTETINALDAKAGMFQRLHGDFGKSKIVSVKPTEASLEMILKDENGLTGVFKLKFDKNNPYLIDGLGVEVSSGD
jgi:hypothetical protein